MKDAFVSPKPANGAVLMVNAASSGAGLAYAARHSDLIFVPSPAGADWTVPARRCPRIIAGHQGAGAGVSGAR